MSASREKKQRRTIEEPTISSRALEEQQKEEQFKRNVKIYSVIGAVLVVLVAILLIWNSGVFQRNAKVAEINGEKITAGEIAYYYNNNTVSQYANMYAQLGMVYPYYDTSVSAHEQTIDEDTISSLGLDEEYLGKTFHEYFVDFALNSLAQERSLCAAAKADGYTLSDEGKEAVKSSLASIDSDRETLLSTYGANYSRTTYLQMIYGELMTEKIYTKCLENAQLATEYKDFAYDTLTDFSEAELDAYYQENAQDIDTYQFLRRYFDGSVPSEENEDGEEVEPTDEEKAAAMEAAKAEAEADLKELEANPDLAKDNEEYSDVNLDAASLSSLYAEWIMSEERQEGDVTLVEGTSGYYVLVFIRSGRDDTPTVNMRHILISAMSQDDPTTTDVDESTQDPVDEVFAAKEQQAMLLLEQWKADGATEEAFAALAEANSADPGSNTNGGLYEKVYQGQMIPAMDEWLFDAERKSGDTGLVKNTESSTQGWHVVYYIGQDEPVWKLNAREALWADEVENSVEIVRTDKLADLFK